MFRLTSDAALVDKQKHVFQDRRKETVSKLLETMIFHKFIIVQYCTFAVQQYFIYIYIIYNMNPLRTKVYLSDLKIQSVPRSKHTLPRL